MDEGTAKKCSRVPGTNQTYDPVVPVTHNPIMTLVSYITMLTTNFVFNMHLFVFK